MPLNYDNHLEVYLRKNKEPPKKKPGVHVTTVFTLAVTATLTLQVNGVLDLGNYKMKGTVAESIPETDQPIPEPTEIPQFTPPAQPIPNPLNNFQTVDTSSVRVQIHPCSHYHSSGANFRELPLLSSKTIKGMVAIGDWVALTGLTVNSDGIIWYEVMNETPLLLSAEGHPDAFNPAPFQYGWIASCFIE